MLRGIKALERLKIYVISVLVLSSLANAQRDHEAREALKREKEIREMDKLLKKYMRNLNSLKGIEPYDVITTQRVERMRDEAPELARDVFKVHQDCYYIQDDEICDYETLQDFQFRVRRELERFEKSKWPPKDH